MENTHPKPYQQYHIIIEKQPLPKPKSLFGVEYDSWTLILGFLVPLLSFALGFISAVLIDQRKEKKDVTVSSDSFFVWIKRTLKSSKMLLEEIEKRKNEAEILDGFQIEKPDFINLHLNRLTIDQNNLYKAFVKLKTGDQQENFNDYSKIIVDIDFLSDFQKMILQNSQYIVEDFQDLFSKWNDSIRRLHKAKHELVGPRIKEGGVKPRVINDQFNTWFKMEEPGLSNTHKFLKSLEPILQDYYNADPSDSELADLLSIAQQTIVIYKQFIFERKRIHDMYEKFYIQLNETITEMEELSQKIKSKKNKRFL